MGLLKPVLYRKVWQLAWPAILQLSFQTTVGMIIMILVGRISAEALAAVGLAQRIIFLLLGVLMAFGVGTTTLVAHYIGAKDEEMARQATAQSIAIGMLVALVFASLIHYFAFDLIGLMMFKKPDPEVIALGGVYLSLVGWGLILEMPLMIVNAGLQGAGDTRTPMFLMVLLNVVTLLAGFVLIYGFGPIAPLKLLGAGLAEAIARGVGSLAALLLVFSGRLRLALKIQQLIRFNPKLLRELIEVGLPAVGEQFIRQSSQMLYTVFVAGMGTAVIAANQIAMTVFSLSFMPGFGFGVAATALVGQSLGAGNKDLAESYGWISNQLGAALMGLMGLLFLIYARPLANLFTTVPEVGQLAAGCIRIIAFAQIPFAGVMIFSGALRGAGDTKFVMYSAAIGQWGIRLVLTYFFAFVLKLGLTGVWLGMFGDAFFRGGLNAWRFRKGSWKEVFQVHQSPYPKTN